MAEYKKLIIPKPEAISKISELFENLKTGIDLISNMAKTSVEYAKLQASAANLALLALQTALEEIIIEIEKLKGGTLSGITAHPYAYGIKAVYERTTIEEIKRAISGVEDPTVDISSIDFDMEAVIAKHTRTPGTMTLTAMSALEQVQDAMDDEADDLAPDKFNDYWGLVIVGSVPGIKDFYKILESVGKFFSQQDLIDLAEQLKDRWEGDDEEVKLPEGLAFYGTSMAEIFPAYIKLLNKVQSFVEGIKSGIISTRGSLDDIMEFIEKKLAEAEDIAEDMKDFLDKFIIELSEAGLYYKVFEGQKADDIKDELTNGTLESWNTSKYSLVLGIFGGSGSMEVVLNFVA